MERFKTFLEISQAENPNGRRAVKVVLHEIHPNNQFYNENGITYLEQYTRDNAESVKHMPLCAEFMDENKDVPYGHGLTGNIENMPIFEDSVQVGHFYDWSIEDIEIDGEKKRCLCAMGYVNESRYPHFVKWLEDKIARNEAIHGSVEFVGTKENDGEIKYDGGWKEKGRIPMVYDYSGYCIISVRPSDASAVVLELEAANNEFDSVFGDNLGNIETNGTANNEFDSVFDDIPTEIKEHNQELSEYADKFLDEVPEEKQNEFEVFE